MHGTGFSTYLPTDLPAYLHTYLPPYLNTYIPTFFPTYIPTYLPSSLCTYLHICLPACLPTYLSFSIPTYLRSNLLAGAKYHQRAIHRYLVHKKSPPPPVSYERGTPVHARTDAKTRAHSRVGVPANLSLRTSLTGFFCTPRCLLLFYCFQNRSCKALLP